MTPSASDQRTMVLFSGDGPSTLAAIRAGQSDGRVVLLTCVHRGLRNLDAVERRVRALGRFFGDRERFEHRVARTDRMLRFLIYERSATHLRRCGLVALAPCAPCRLARHWRAAVECARSGCGQVCDGAGGTMLDAAIGERLRAFYGALGIDYEGMGDPPEEVERTLEAMRFRDEPFEGKENRDLRCDMKTLDRLLRGQKEEGPASPLAGLLADKIGVMERMSAGMERGIVPAALARLIED